MRNIDKSRDIADFTCPLIDYAIELLKNYDIDYIDNAIEKLEEVRKHNGNLRDWGNGLYKDLSDKEDEYDDLKKDYESLKYNYDVLKKDYDNIS